MGLIYDLIVKTNKGESQNDKCSSEEECKVSKER